MGFRALVIGLGAVGSRAARQLVADPAVDRVLVTGHRPERARAVAASLGERARAIEDPSKARPHVTVLCVPSSRQPHLAESALRRGSHVVAVADGLRAVDALLELHDAAAAKGKVVAVGAGFSPGLSCVLARHAALELDVVEEVHIARYGTGGPACARQHHNALGSTALDWRGGEWHRRPGGSGRELSFFPDPIGGADCYRAGLPDARLLIDAFPAASRITARLAATRRDRLTARLPMLRRPHPEGRIGASRVELRGRQGGASTSVVYGAIDRPAVAAGVVAATTARWIGTGAIDRPGAAGLAVLVDPLAFLHDLAAVGVRAAVFEGTEH